MSDSPDLLEGFEVFIPPSSPIIANKEHILGKFAIDLRVSDIMTRENKE